MAWKKWDVFKEAFGIDMFIHSESFATAFDASGKDLSVLKDSMDAFPLGTWNVKKYRGIDCTVYSLDKEKSGDKLFIIQTPDDVTKAMSPERLEEYQSDLLLDFVQHVISE